MQHVTPGLTRTQLLSHGAKGGTAFLVAGLALGQYPRAAAADPLPLSDLAYARLLVGAELLAADFYAQAVAASNTGKGVAKVLRRARANELEHYASVAGILSGAGFTPAVASDFDFSFPKGTFSSAGSMLAFGAKLESTLLGAYLGAIGAMQTAGLKQGLAQIAASEAQHLSYLSAVHGARPFSLAFPAALTIDQASDALDVYTA